MADGAKIKHIMEERGMTQRQLADVMGMKPPNVCEMLKGETNMTEKTLWKLCGALDCTPEDIR